MMLNCSENLQTPEKSWFEPKLLMKEVEICLIHSVNEISGEKTESSGDVFQVRCAHTHTQEQEATDCT